MPQPRAGRERAFRGDNNSVLTIFSLNHSHFEWPRLRLRALRTCCLLSAAGVLLHNPLLYTKFANRHSTYLPVRGGVRRELPREHFPPIMVESLPVVARNLDEFCLF
jgi:hypothetical protein